MKLTAEVGEYKLYEEPMSEPPRGRVTVEVRKGSGEGEEVYRLPKPVMEKSSRLTACFVHENYTKMAMWQRKNVLYRPTDIVVTTYPKCGTTFSEQIVLLLLCGGDKGKLDASTQNSLQASKTGVGKIWAETCVVPDDFVPPEKLKKMPPAFKPIPLTQYEAFPDPRVMKTHGSTTTVLSTNPETGSLAPAKYLVVTRNVFDACVSGFHHAWNPSKSGWPFEAWALSWMNWGWDAHGDYFDWHVGWHAFRERYPPKEGGVPEEAEILWLHYEDMIQSPREHVIKIAKFIGVEPSPDLIDKVVEGSSFGSMKAQALENKEGLGHAKGNSFRSGKAGGWRSFFTPEVEELFRKKYKETLSPLGMEFQIGNGEILN